jgi:hypothetical protein
VDSSTILHFWKSSVLWTCHASFGERDLLYFSVSPPGTTACFSRHCSFSLWRHCGVALDPGQWRTLTTTTFSTLNSTETMAHRLCLTISAALTTSTLPRPQARRELRGLSVPLTRAAHEEAVEQAHMVGLSIFGEYKGAS